MIIKIIGAMFVFGLLVSVHELGHFMVAKLTGMRVDEFAIGFGPKVWSKKYGETLYTLRAVPLGGFNRIAGIDYEIIENMDREGGRSKEKLFVVPDEEDAGERAYFRRPIWARMAVILAGSIMNFILPLFIFFGLFLTQGVATPSPEPVIGAVIEDRPAAMAGLRAGDRILTLDGQPVNQWSEISQQLQGKAERPFKVTYQRDGKELSTTLIPEEDAATNRAVIGITSSAMYYQPGVIEAAKLAVTKEIYLIGAMVGGLVQLVQGTVSTAELSGPVGVAQMAGQVAEQGIWPLLGFAAFLSLNLGIVNLLPIPALDGGHFIMLVLEALRGKPMKPVVMYYIQVTGVVILVSLMLFTTFNDLTK